MIEKASQQRRRLTSQQQQERTSRSQFEEALDGWICNPLTNDMGEDYHISIYDEGCSTGVTFLVQLKSTTTWKTLLPKRNGEELHYPLEVKDLTHWSDTSPPVVVVVWDTVERRGFWQDVPSIIKVLDRKQRSWRKNASVTASIPIRQTLDSEGRGLLRHRIARLSLPAISKGKQLKIRPTFRFPNTSEGQVELDALQRAFEEGNKIKITREDISKFKMSSWWERAFGQIGIPNEITIQPEHRDLAVTVLVTATGNGRVETLPIELRHVKGGTKLVVLSNEGTGSPIRLRVSLDARIKGGTVNFGYNLPGKEVLPALQATRLLRIVAEGGSLHLALLDGRSLMRIHHEMRPRPDVPSLVGWEQLLVHLFEIQPRVEKYGRFSLSTSYTGKEYEDTLKVHAMCTQGQIEGSLDINATLRPSLNTPSEMAMTIDPESELFSIPPVLFDDIVLFGVRIPAGWVRPMFQDTAKVKEALATARASGAERITLRDSPVLFKFLDWEPPRSGPAPAIEITSQPSVARPAPKKGQSRKPK